MCSALILLAVIIMISTLRTTSFFRFGTMRGLFSEMKKAKNGKTTHHLTSGWGREGEENLLHSQQY